MKIALIFNLIILMVLLSVVGCSHKKKDNFEVKSDSVNPIDSSFLASRNFVYKNLTNTTLVYFITKRPKGSGLDLSNMYTDSSFKRTYNLLSDDQKGALIAPFLPKGYGVKYAKENMCAWCVSKQNKIGDLQPIVVLEIGKADYESLNLIVLDKNYKPVSEFSLDEGNSTNNEIGYPYKTKNYSVLNKSEIVSYRISENTDSSKKQVVIDSNVFKSFINKDGTISTTQIGKTRFVRSFK